MAVSNKKKVKINNQKLYYQNFQLVKYMQL